jgi:tetratricopeptide (TPR) repeat protein
MRTPARLSVLLLIVNAAAGAAFAAGAPVEKSPPPSQQQPGVLSRDAYVRLARAIVDEYLAGVDEWTRPNVAAAFAPSGPDAPPEKLASGAAALAAFGRSEGVLLAARAAAYKPDDAAIASTLGAALSRAGRNDQAIPVLLYARSLAPTLALVLTNLAAAYADTGDEAQAERLLLQATNADPKSCGAWKALSVLYLNQRKVKEAVEAYLHTAPCSGFSVRERQTIEGPYDTPPPAPVLHWSQPEITRLTSNKAGRPLFRPFPAWTRWEDMVASATSLEAWDKNVTARFQVDADAEAMAKAAMQEYQARATRPKAYYLDPFDAADMAVQLDVKYYNGRLKKISSTYLAAQKAADDEMKRAIDGPRKTFEAKMKAAGADLQAVRAAHQEFCKPAREVVARGFVAWRDAARASYEQRVEVYTELLGVTQPWVESVADPNKQKMLELRRLGAIWASLSPQFFEYPLRGLLYAMTATSAVGPCAPDQGTEPEELKAEEGELDKPRFKCPVPEGWSEGIRLFESEKTGTSVELTVSDCTAFELEVKQGKFLGVTGSGKYNMRNKNVTLAGGVYAETTSLTPGVETKLTWKSTMEVTFKEGQLVDVSFVTGPEVAVGGVAFAKWEDKMTFTLWNSPAEK